MADARGSLERGRALSTADMGQLSLEVWTSVACWSAASASSIAGGREHQCLSAFTSNLMSGEKTEIVAHANCGLDRDKAQSAALLKLLCNPLPGIRTHIQSRSDRLP